MKNALKRFTAMAVAILMAGYFMFLPGNTSQQLSSYKSFKKREAEIDEEKSEYKNEYKSSYKKFEKDSDDQGKKEIIYVNLNADGSPADIYAVNHFKIEDANKVYSDYGDYAELRRLSKSLKFDYSQKDQKLSFKADEGPFMYQGKLKNRQLPWKIDLKYLLDGKPVLPENLSGAEGLLEIAFNISQNTKCKDKSFFDSYMIQAAFTFDIHKAELIEAADANVATVGSKTMINYIILPGLQNSYKIKCKIKDFSMEGATFTALPLSLDLEEYTADIEKEFGRFKELHEGIEMLNAGAGELKEGGEGLAAGSDNLNNGIFGILAGFGRLYAGLETFSDGLCEYHCGVAEYVDGVGEVKDGSTKLKSGAFEIADGMLQLLDGSQELSAGAAEIGDGIDLFYESVLPLKDSDEIDELVEMFNAFDVDAVLEVLNKAEEMLPQFELFKNADIDFAQIKQMIIMLNNFTNDDIDTMIYLLEVLKKNLSIYERHDSGMRSAFNNYRSYSFSKVCGSSLPPEETVFEGGDRPDPTKPQATQTEDQGGQNQNIQDESENPETPDMPADPSAEDLAKNAELLKKIEELTASLEQLRQEKADEIAKLTADLEAKEAGLSAKEAELQSALDDLKAIKEKNADLSAAAEETQELQKQIEQLQEEIGKLQKSAAENKDTTNKEEESENSQSGKGEEGSNHVSPPLGTPPTQEQIDIMIDLLKKFKEVNKPEKLPSVEDIEKLEEAVKKLQQTDSSDIKAQIADLKEKLKLIKELQAKSSQMSIDELVDNVGKLAAGYKEFENGLGQFLWGYNKLVNGFCRFSPNEDNMSFLQGLIQLDNGIGTLAEEGKKLSEGGCKLYKGFDDALNGMSEFNAGIQQLGGGMNDFNEGFKRYIEGLEEYKDGMQKLDDETSGLDKKISDEMKDAIAEMTGKDFESHSFISNKNQNVSAVQFIMMTPEAPPIVNHDSTFEDDNDENVWDRIKDLFGN